MGTKVQAVGDLDDDSALSIRQPEEMIVVTLTPEENKTSLIAAYARHGEVVSVK